MAEDNQKTIRQALSTTSLTSSNYNFRSKTLIGSLFCASVIHYVLQGWDFNLSWKFSLIGLAVFMDITVIISAILLLDPERTNFHSTGEELKFESLIHTTTNIMNLGLERLMPRLLDLVFGERGKEAAELTIKGMVGVAMAFNLLKTYVYSYSLKLSRATEIEDGVLALRKIRAITHEIDLQTTNALLMLAMGLYGAMSWGIFTRVEVSDNNRLTVIENLDYIARVIAWLIRLVVINNVALAAEIVADIPLVAGILNRAGLAGFPLTIVEKNGPLQQVEKFFQDLENLMKLVKDFGEKTVKKCIQDIKNIAEITFDTIETFLQDVKNGKILELVEDGIEALKKSFAIQYNDMAKSLEAVQDELQKQVNAISEELQDKVQQLAKLIEENLSLKVLKESLDKEYQKLKEMLDLANTQIKNFAQTAQDQAQEILKKIQENEILEETVKLCNDIEKKIWKSWAELRKKNKTLKALKDEIMKRLVREVNEVTGEAGKVGKFIAESVGISSQKVDQATQTENQDIDMEPKNQGTSPSVSAYKEEPKEPHFFACLVGSLPFAHSHHQATSAGNTNTPKTTAEDPSKEDKGPKNSGKKHSLDKGEENEKQNNNSKLIDYFGVYKTKEVNLSLKMSEIAENRPYNEEKEQEDLAKDIIKNLAQEQYIVEIKKTNNSQLVEINDYYKSYHIEMPLLTLDAKFLAEVW